MNRREAMGLTAVGLLTLPMALQTSASPGQRVRIVCPRGQGLRVGRVYCARTGEDLSTRFPVSIAHRLRRSFETQRPVRVSLYRLIGGCHFLEGTRIAREMVTVLVTSIEEA